VSQIQLVLQLPNKSSECQEAQEEEADAGITNTRTRSWLPFLNNAMSEVGGRFRRDVDVGEAERLPIGATNEQVPKRGGRRDGRHGRVCMKCR